MSRAERVHLGQAWIPTCRRKRVSPEASIDLEATSEGDSGTSEEGVSVSSHSGDSSAEAQERSTSQGDPLKGPTSRRSGRKTKCAATLILACNVLALRHYLTAWCFGLSSTLW